VGWELSGVLQHKSGNISETHDKDRGKDTEEGYRNSLTLFRTVASSTPYSLFPKIAGSQPPPNTSIAIVGRCISGTAKAIYRLWLAATFIRSIRTKAN